MTKRHLYEIDLMRAFIMLGVLSVHTTSFFNVFNQDMTTPYLTLGVVITTLHFTREAFMFITGLVLFVTYYHKSFRARDFWRKRFLLIVVPYIAWNVIYIVFQGIMNSSFNWAPGALFETLRQALFTGNEYFLYYVLVSMQLYVVFPLLLKGLKRFEQYHVQILIGSFIFQLLLMALNKFVLEGLNPNVLPPVISNLDQYRDRFVLTYQFWFIAGGILACHYDKFVTFARRHARAIRVSLVIALAVLWCHYFLDRLVLHETEGLSELVLQPIMIPYSLLAALNIWLAGLMWSDRRLKSGWKPFSRFIAVASSTSFGIFLFQPFPLYYMESFIHHLQLDGAPTWLHYSLWPFCILFVYFSGMAAAHVIGKIPFLSYIVGRKTRFPHGTNAPTNLARSN